MTEEILEAVRGQTSSVESDAREGAISYNTGGYSYRSDLGRVDVAQAQNHGTSQIAKVTNITDDNLVVVQVFSQTAGVVGEIGQEVAADQEVNDEISLAMYRL